MQNMQKVNLIKASKITSPNPVALVCTLRPDGGTNVAAASWWTFVAFNPDLFVLSMLKTGYSGELFRQFGEALIAIPGVGLQEKALKCGKTTGRKTNKVKEFGIEMKDYEGSKIQAPANSRLIMRLKLKEYFPVGPHFLYICEVTSAYADESIEALYAFNGYEDILPLNRSN